MWAGASHGEVAPIASALAPAGRTSPSPPTTLQRAALACPPGSPGGQGCNPQPWSVGAAALTTSPQDEPAWDAAALHTGRRSPAVPALLRTARVLRWGVDGTPAVRPGQWAGVVGGVVAVERPAGGLRPARLSPPLQGGFPGHAPDVVRQPCPAAQGWRALLPALARAVPSAAGLGAPDARRLVTGGRAASTDAQGWRLFDDVVPARACLRDRGGRHRGLSHHAPELPRLVGAMGRSAFRTAVDCSARTGVGKPHRQAFETVSARDPAAPRGGRRGDSGGADVRGALAVGRRATLVRSERPAAALPCQTLREAEGSWGAGNNRLEPTPYTAWPMPGR